MLQPLVPSLLLTYGVVKRVQNILRSPHLKETGAEHKELEHTLDHLCVMFPEIYRTICAPGYAEHRLEVSLRRFRAHVCDIEDILEVAVTDHQLKQKQYTGGGHGRAPRSSEFRFLRERRHDRRHLLRSLTRQVLESAADLRRFCFSSMAGSIKSIGNPSFLSSTIEITGASSLLYYDGSEETIVGRESEKEQVLDWIFNSTSQQDVNVISISGPEGIGKTTLAKMISSSISASFDIVSWVDMVPSAFEVKWDLECIIAKIIGSFPNQSRYYTQRMDKGKLQHILRDLLNGRKYLLVLDDYMFEERAEWKKLREILEVGSAGSTVIVTSWGDWIDTTKCLRLQGLPENDCWSLLSECAGFNEETEQEYPFLKSIKKSIADKCCGCPLAIKTLGKTLLANRDKHEWKQIVKSEVWTETGSYPTREAVIRSLEYMPSDMAQCALGSVISPQNKAMSRDQLLYLWMAQGLLQSTEINEDPRNIADRYCDELLSVAFLQSCQTDGHDVILRPHNCAGQLALDILREEVAVISDASFPENPRYLIWNGDRSYLDQEFAPGDSPLPSVRTFMFNYQVGCVRKPVLEELISKLTHARVLLLDGAEFEELPESIGNLKLLRYLSLAGNHSLKLLPESICNLPNLQTLDLSGCEQLQTLPNMDDSSNLRHLLLSVNLTTLPAEEAMKSWTSLHHLKICNCPNLSSISEDIAHLTALRVLQVHDCPSIASLPNSIKHLTFLEELRIRNCEMLDLTNWEGLEGLKVLKFLQFQGLPELSKFPEGLQSAADSLQHLLVVNCGNLTALPECLQKCFNLLELIIDNCPNMDTLPKGIQTIEALQVLNIVNCPTLISSCQHGAGEDWHLISHSPKIHLQTRKRGISPFEKHPGAISGEKRLDQQEGTAGPSSQAAGHHSPNQKEGMKDWRCYILFLLPENYEIEKDTLIQLWMAGKYIKGEPIEQQEEKFFGTLVREGYLSCCGTDFMTGKGRYRVEIEKLNGLQLDDQQDTYLKWDNQYQEGKFSAAADSVQHVSLLCNDIDETVFQALQQFTNLRTLLFFADRGHRVKPMPDHLFSGLKNLQALDLSRTNLRELPSSVGHMIQLRYMNLSWTLIERLPDAVCSLVELQTLKLRGCSNLRELPEQLARLTKLQHLDVDALRQLETMPKGIGALINLRTLPAFLVGTEDGHKIQELKELNNLSGSLCIAELEHVQSAEEASEAALEKKQHLEKLELRWTASELSGTHNDSDQILKFLQPCTSLEELQISCYEGSRFPRWIRDVEFDKLARIVFYRCENLSELPLIEQLPHLKHLELIMMNSVTRIEHRGELENGVFPALEKLEIHDMQSLEVWDWKKGNKISDFKSLAELIINDCPELVEFDVLPHLSSIKHFDIRECPKLVSLSNEKVPGSLQMLIVEGCPKIQKRCKNGGADWLKIQHVQTKCIQKDDEDGDVDEAGTTCIQAVPTKCIQKEDEDEDESPDEMKRDENPTAGTSSQVAVHYSSNETTLNQPNREHETTHEVQQISSMNDNLQEHETKNQDQQTPPTTTNQTTTRPENLQVEDLLQEAFVENEMKHWGRSMLRLLPENYEIEKDTLIQLWMAGKYLKGEPIEQHEEKFFGTLEREEYLSPCGTDFMTGKERYRVEIEKLNELQLDDQQDTYFKWDNQYQGDSSSPAAESAQHVSFVCNDIDETVFQALQQFTNLRTLLFFANRGHRVKTIPDHLFSGLKNLQALDLSRTNLRELPSSVGHMIQLRYMNLSWTLIERLPDTVCSLVELQTLRLRGCANLHVLPKQLARLTKLQHLDVDVLRQLETMPKGIGALVNLRTLPAFLIGVEDGSKIQELKQLNNLSGFLCIAKLEHVKEAEEASEAALGKKEHLQKLELRWTASELSGAHNSRQILKRLQPCTSLEELQILCYEGSTFPLWIGDVEFNKLARIVFYRCENLSDLPLIEQLPHLKHLELIMMNSVEKIERRGELEKGVFPALEKLEIDDMQSLKVWDWKKRNKSDFKSLAALIINDCPELVEFDVLPHLSSINYFDISKCPNLESLSDKPVPDTLKKLIVQCCPKIQGRYSKDEGEDWYNIQHVPTKCIKDEDETEDEDETVDEGESEDGNEDEDQSEDEEETEDEDEAGSLNGTNC